MVQTSARLLALLSLLQMRREWTGQELADRLEVGPRTIRRDVDKLRSLGYPVEAAPGVAGGYRLGAGGELPPLLLDDAEAVAVAVGLRTAAAGGIAGIEETSVRALTKLEQVLPEPACAGGSARSATPPRRSASRARGSTPTCWRRWPAPAATAPACGSAYIARDEQGIAAQHRASLPSSTAATAGTWSRSTSIATTGARSGSTGSAAGSGRGSAAAGGPCPAATRRRSSRSGCAECGRASADAPRRDESACVPPAARIRGRIPVRYAIVEPDGEDACIVTSRGAWSHGFLVWMATLDEPMEVLDPPELAEAARALAARLGAAA